MVGRRRHLLNYLRSKDIQRYRELIKSLLVSVVNLNITSLRFGAYLCSNLKFTIKSFTNINIYYMLS